MRDDRFPSNQPSFYPAEARQLVYVDAISPRATRDHWWLAPEVLRSAFRQNVLCVVGILVSATYGQLQDLTRIPALRR